MHTKYGDPEVYVDVRGRAALFAERHPSSTPIRSRSASARRVRDPAHCPRLGMKRCARRPACVSIGVPGPHRTHDLPP